jgi:periplasmic protein CpxP/Spy
MKIKHLSLVAGAIALTLTTTSLAVNAETTSSSSFLVAQEQPRGRKGIWQELGLTDAQKTQIQEIRRNSREEINKILTEEQRAQLAQVKNSMQNQSSRRGGWKSMMDSLNLSEEQKTQIREVKRSQKAQIEAVLTEEQREQFKKIREERRARRQQYRQNGQQ